MELKPQSIAPGDKGSGKLEGMSALITGADSGIDCVVPVLFARKGARLFGRQGRDSCVHQSVGQQTVGQRRAHDAVASGPVWTPIHPADSPPERIKHFGKGTDMGRPAQPEELSPADVFLASPACAGFVTGMVLPITGSVGP